MVDLKGKICVVTGASRGIGRGIALQLAINGAICYISGRCLSTLEIVREEAVDRGANGKIIPIECDHSCDQRVSAFFQKIASENDGQLDLLVNNAYSALEFVAESATKNFWDLPIDCWDLINNVGLRNHYICAVHASRLMVSRQKGLIVNISSVGGVTYLQTPAYGIGKAAKDRMARDCSLELAKYGVAFVSVWPGPVRTESVMNKSDEFLAKPEYQWMYDNGESTEFLGKCISHLLLDPNVTRKSGQVVLSTDLASEYGVTDVDGKSPISMRSFRAAVGLTGYTWLADYIPGWLQYPKWLYLVLLSRFVNLPHKDRGDYA